MATEEGRGTSGVVYRAIGEVGDALTILDAGRRTYAGLSHDGTYWHLIAPFAGVDGELVCTCKGGRMHGRCWRMDQAIAFEAGDARQASLPFARPVWARQALDAGIATFDAPAGAGEMVEASRG